MSFLLNLQSYSWCKPVDSPDESELNNGNLQSSFLNWLWKGRCNCYGHHTWAEARRGGILGYGERESQDKVVKTFEEILKGLAGLDDTTVDKLAVTVEERTFKCAAELGMLWVKTYWKFMQKSLREHLRVLCRAGAEQRQVNHSPTKKEMNNLPWPEMMAWLSSFKDHEEEILQLCQFAYRARALPYMKALNKRKGSTSTLTEELNKSNFLQPWHYIGCLSSHTWRPQKHMLLLQWGFLHSLTTSR